jgi:DNA-binding MarR family transcriptional regulator
MPSKTSIADQPTTARESRDLGVLRDVLGFRLRRIQNHLAQTFAERLAGREIKAGEFSALAIIAANPGVSQIELSREGGFDKASVVAMIDDFERWGWAERRRSTTDRRRHALYVTPAGETVVAELFEIAKQNEARIGQVLSPAELAHLFGMLDRIYDLCFADEDT